jgi:hypothetical protein
MASLKLLWAQCKRSLVGPQTHIPTLAAGRSQHVNENYINLKCEPISGVPCSCVGYVSHMLPVLGDVGDVQMCEYSQKA